MNSSELNPLFLTTDSSAPQASSSAGPELERSPSPGPSPTRRRTGVFERESTIRLRSNVADQVHRDLLPAGRMLSVFLVMCELLAEVAVLIATRSQPCDRPLRLWVVVLILLQSGTIFLNCLNIHYGRDAFTPHRDGLSASDPEMYATLGPLGGEASSRDRERHSQARSSSNISPSTADFFGGSPVQEPSLGDTSGSSADSDGSSSSSSMMRAGAPFLPGATSSIGNIDFVDRYVRIVNAWYLVWFIAGSIWVSNGGTCHITAPHLYRLTVALTIIYYALLFLPLACFCLIVCCLPLFILVYRIMLPIAERERRRARAADPTLVQRLSVISYSSADFQSLTGSENLEDATCVICLCEYEPGDQVRFLPCKHHFHKDCVDVWLQLDKACCLCKQDIDSGTASAV